MENMEILKVRGSRFRVTDIRQPFSKDILVSYWSAVNG